MPSKVKRQTPRVRGDSARPIDFPFEAQASRPMEIRGSKEREMRGIRKLDNGALNLLYCVSVSGLTAQVGGGCPMGAGLVAE